MPVSHMALIKLSHVSVSLSPVICKRREAIPSSQIIVGFRINVCQVPSMCLASSKLLSKRI